jgi:hypothetical protein
MKNLVQQCDLADATQATPHESDSLPKIPEEKPKLTAEQKMFAGTGLADAGANSDPNKDLRWLPAEEFEAVRLLRMAWRDYEEGWVPEIGAYLREGALVTFPNGTRVDLNELREEQHKLAYDLLRRGASVKDVSAATYRPEAWVLQIKNDFNL